MRLCAAFSFPVVAYRAVSRHVWPGCLQGRPGPFHVLASGFTCLEGYFAFANPQVRVLLWDMLVVFEAVNCAVLNG